MFTILLVSCAKIVATDTLYQTSVQSNAKIVIEQPKQELTHAHDWVKAWDMCSGYMGLKKDGSLWQFGELGHCNWGEIIGVMDDMVIKKIYTYPLEPKKIAKGFKDAKIINGGFCFYAVKKDGTLWGWVNGIDAPFGQIGRDSNWVTVGINTGVHDIVGFNIGLKKDGSLCKIPRYHENNQTTEPTALGRDKGWDKVVIDSCIIYAQREDGILWTRDEEEFVVIQKREVFKEIYPRLQEKMKKISSKEIMFESYTSEINVKPNGTLWLPPIITNKYVDKYKPITLHPSHKKGE